MEVKLAREEDYPRVFLSRLDELEEKVGYRFRNRKYLWIALTHSSFSNEKRSKVLYEHNERQEFLGDSVLSLVISRHLFSDHATFPEGMLTKLRAASVCADALYEYASALNLSEYMLLNHGLSENGVKKHKNILADCFEALLGGIYLDGGFDEAERFVLRLAKDRMLALLEGGKIRDEDYKSLLQEKVQTSPGEKVEYRLIGEKGPDHKKEFSVEVRINSNVIGNGTGTSKREAEQAAAKMALATWFGEGK
ncbi:MAG: ribonuclease III [Ruminococcaceae bacterium]|nr:ribonuclease III [Oscillospiraceae bacterium]